MGEPGRQIARRILRQTQRLEAWVEARPWVAWALALLVLGLVGFETAFWPLHDYPGAMWHHTPRGDDIELAQAHAATAGWKELAGYWHGPMIHGHGYYRPLASWLFVAEFHLFGTDDRRWAIVNILLHLSLAALLLWAAGVFAGGPRLRRLGVGVLAALLLGAPGLADRSTQMWIIGWWPCQPDILSLLCGLTLLAATVLYCRTGERKWARMAPWLFFLAVCFKETGYLAGLGACLVLVRHPRARALLFTLAGCGLAFFFWRAVSLKGMGPTNGPSLKRAATDLATSGNVLVNQVRDYGGQLAVAGLAAGLGWALRRRLGLVESGLVAAAFYLALGSVLFGPPWVAGSSLGIPALVGWGVSAALLLGLVMALRRWPIPELTAVYLMSVGVALSFPPVFGWYRYWGSVFGAFLTAVSMAALVEYGGRRLQELPAGTPKKGSEHTHA
jgi:hypothetical protein